MKKELVTHFSFTIAFLIFVTLFKRWFNLAYWPFWVGGLAGTLLPDLDHLIYVFFYAPHELTSQRVKQLFDRRQFWPGLKLLTQTHRERTKLIFHTAFFQIIFLILTFWVVTSSGNLFGRGLVLAFALHLSIDQLVDFLEVDNLDNWFNQEPIRLVLEKQQTTIYWVIVFLLVLFLGFLF